MRVTKRSVQVLSAALLPRISSGVTGAELQQDRFRSLVLGFQPDEGDNMAQATRDVMAEDSH